MTPFEKIKRELQDPFRSFRILEIIIASICITLPLWLYLIDTADSLRSKCFRGSISDYVNMTRSYFFGMFMCIAAMLFIVNGAVYFKREERLHLNKAGKWYNVILGVCLMLVICFHHEDWPKTHLTFAISFFVGNALVMAFFHDKKYRFISLTLALSTLIVFAILKWLKVNQWVFWAEWLSLALIGIHQILQATRVIQDFRNKELV